MKTACFTSLKIEDHYELAIAEFIEYLASIKSTKDKNTINLIKYFLKTRPERLVKKLESKKGAALSEDFIEDIEKLYLIAATDYEFAIASAKRLNPDLTDVVDNAMRYPKLNESLKEVFKTFYTKSSELRANQLATLKEHLTNERPVKYTEAEKAIAQEAADKEKQKAEEEIKEVNDKLKEANDKITSLTKLLIEANDRVGKETLTDSELDKLSQIVKGTTLSKEQLEELKKDRSKVDDLIDSLKQKLIEEIRNAQHENGLLGSTITEVTQESEAELDKKALDAKQDAYFHISIKRVPRSNKAIITLRWVEFNSKGKPVVKRISEEIDNYTKGKLVNLFGPMLNLIKKARQQVSTKFKETSNAVNRMLNSNKLIVHTYSIPKKFTEQSGVNKSKIRIFHRELNKSIIDSRKGKQQIDVTDITLTMAKEAAESAGFQGDSWSQLGTFGIQLIKEVEETNDSFGKNDSTQFNKNALYVVYKVGDTVLPIGKIRREPAISEAQLSSFEHLLSDLKGKDTPKLEDAIKKAIKASDSRFIELNTDSLSTSLIRSSRYIKELQNGDNRSLNNAFDDWSNKGLGVYRKPFILTVSKGQDVALNNDASYKINEGFNKGTYTGLSGKAVVFVSEVYTDEEVEEKVNEALSKLKGDNIQKVFDSLLKYDHIHMVVLRNKKMSVYDFIKANPLLNAIGLFQDKTSYSVKGNIHEHVAHNSSIMFETFVDPSNPSRYKLRYKQEGPTKLQIRNLEGNNVDLPDFDKNAQALSKMMMGRVTQMANNPEIGLVPQIIRSFTSEVEGTTKKGKAVNIADQGIFIYDSAVDKQTINKDRLEKHNKELHDLVFNNKGELTDLGQHLTVIYNDLYNKYTGNYFTTKNEEGFYPAYSELQYKNDLMLYLYLAVGDNWDKESESKGLAEFTPVAPFKEQAGKFTALFSEWNNFSPLSPYSVLETTYLGPLSPSFNVTVEPKHLGVNKRKFAQENAHKANTETSKIFESVKDKGVDPVNSFKTKIGTKPSLEESTILLVKSTQKNPLNELVEILTSHIDQYLRLENSDVYLTGYNQYIEDVVKLINEASGTGLDADSIKTLIGGKVKDKVNELRSTGKVTYTLDYFNIKEEELDALVDADTFFTAMEKALVFAGKPLYDSTKTYKAQVYRLNEKKVEQFISDLNDRGNTGLVLNELKANPLWNKYVGQRNAGTRFKISESIGDYLVNLISKDFKDIDLKVLLDNNKNLRQGFVELAKRLKSNKKIADIDLGYIYDQLSSNLKFSLLKEDFHMLPENKDYSGLAVVINLLQEELFDIHLPGMKWDEVFILTKSTKVTDFGRSINLHFEEVKAESKDEEDDDGDDDLLELQENPIAQSEPELKGVEIFPSEALDTLEDIFGKDVIVTFTTRETREAVDKMYQQGKISEEQYERAIKELADSSIGNWSKVLGLSFIGIIQLNTNPSSGKVLEETVYHEALHRTLLLFTPGHREAVYKAARSRYKLPDSASNKEVEERMATEYGRHFRNFEPSWSARVIAKMPSLLRRLFMSIRRMYHSIIKTDIVAKLYNDIRSGVYVGEEIDPSALESLFFDFQNSNNDFFYNQLAKKLFVEYVDGKAVTDSVRVDNIRGIIEKLIYSNVYRLAMERPSVEGLKTTLISQFKKRINKGVYGLEADDIKKLFTPIELDTLKRNVDGEFITEEVLPIDVIMDSLDLAEYENFDEDIEEFNNSGEDSYRRNDERFQDNKKAVKVSKRLKAHLSNIKELEIVSGEVNWTTRFADYNSVVKVLTKAYRDAQEYSKHTYPTDKELADALYRLHRLAPQTRQGKAALSVFMKFFNTGEVNPDLYTFSDSVKLSDRISYYLIVNNDKVGKKWLKGEERYDDEESFHYNLKVTGTGNPALYTTDYGNILSLIRNHFKTNSNNFVELEVTSSNSTNVKIIDTYDISGESNILKNMSKSSIIHKVFIKNNGRWDYNIEKIKEYFTNSKPKTNGKPFGQEGFTVYAYDYNGTIEDSEEIASEFFKLTKFLGIKIPDKVAIQMFAYPTDDIVTVANKFTASVNKLLQHILSVAEGKGDVIPRDIHRYFEIDINTDLNNGLDPEYLLSPTTFYTLLGSIQSYVEMALDNETSQTKWVEDQKGNKKHSEQQDRTETRVLRAIRAVRNHRDNFKDTEVVAHFSNLKNEFFTNTVFRDKGLFVTPETKYLLKSTVGGETKDFTKMSVNELFESAFRMWNKGLSDAKGMVANLPLISSPVSDKQSQKSRVYKVRVDAARLKFEDKTKDGEEVHSAIEKEAITEMFIAYSSYMVGEGIEQINGLIEVMNFLAAKTEEAGNYQAMASRLSILKDNMLAELRSVKPYQNPEAPSKYRKEIDKDGKVVSVDITKTEEYKAAFKDYQLRYRDEEEIRMDHYYDHLRPTIYKHAEILQDTLREMQSQNGELLETALSLSNVRYNPKGKSGFINKPEGVISLNKELMHNLNPELDYFKKRAEIKAVVQYEYDYLRSQGLSKVQGQDLSEIGGMVRDFMYTHYVLDWLGENIVSGMSFYYKNFIEFVKRNVKTNTNGEAPDVTHPKGLRKMFNVLQVEDMDIKDFHPESSTYKYLETNGVSEKETEKPVDDGQAYWSPLSHMLAINSYGGKYVNYQSMKFIFGETTKLGKFSIAKVTNEMLLNGGERVFNKVKKMLGGSSSPLFRKWMSIRSGMTVEQLKAEEDWKQLFDWFIEHRDSELNEEMLEGLYTEEEMASIKDGTFVFDVLNLKLDGTKESYTLDSFLSVEVPVASLKTLPYAVNKDGAKTLVTSQWSTSNMGFIVDLSQDHSSDAMINLINQENYIFNTGHENYEVGKVIYESLGSISESKRNDLLKKLRIRSINKTAQVKGISKEESKALVDAGKGEVDFEFFHEQLEAILSSMGIVSNTLDAVTNRLNSNVPLVRSSYLGAISSTLKSLLLKFKLKGSRYVHQSVTGLVNMYEFEGNSYTSRQLIDRGLAEMKFVHVSDGVTTVFDSYQEAISQGFSDVRHELVFTEGVTKRELKYIELRGKDGRPVEGEELKLWFNALKLQDVGGSLSITPELAIELNRRLEGLTEYRFKVDATTNIEPKTFVSIMYKSGAYVVSPMEIFISRSAFKDFDIDDTTDVGDITKEYFLNRIQTLQIDDKMQQEMLDAYRYALATVERKLSPTGGPFSPREVMDIANITIEKMAKEIAELDATDSGEYKSTKRFPEKEDKLDYLYERLNTVINVFGYSDTESFVEAYNNGSKVSKETIDDFLVYLITDALEAKLSRTSSAMSRFNGRYETVNGEGVITINKEAIKELVLESFIEEGNGYIINPFDSIEGSGYFEKGSSDFILRLNDPEVLEDIAQDTYERFEEKLHVKTTRIPVTGFNSIQYAKVVGFNDSQGNNIWVPSEIQIPGGSDNDGDMVTLEFNSSSRSDSRKVKMVKKMLFESKLSVIRDPRNFNVLFDPISFVEILSRWSDEGGFDLSYGHITSSLKLLVQNQEGKTGIGPIVKGTEVYNTTLQLAQVYPESFGQFKSPIKFNGNTYSTVKGAYTETGKLMPYHTVGSDFIKGFGKKPNYSEIKQGFEDANTFVSVYYGKGLLTNEDKITLMFKKGFNESQIKEYFETQEENVVINLDEFIPEVIAMNLPLNKAYTELRGDIYVKRFIPIYKIFERIANASLDNAKEALLGALNINSNTLGLIEGMVYSNVNEDDMYLLNTHPITKAIVAEVNFRNNLFNKQQRGTAKLKDVFKEIIEGTFKLHTTKSESKILNLMFIDEVEPTEVKDINEKYTPLFKALKDNESSIVVDGKNLTFKEVFEELKQLADRKKEILREFRLVNINRSKKTEKELQELKLEDDALRLKEAQYKSVVFKEYNRLKTDLQLRKDKEIEETLSTYKAEFKAWKADKGYTDKEALEEAVEQWLDINGVDSLLNRDDAFLDESISEQLKGKTLKEITEMASKSANIMDQFKYIVAALNKFETVGDEMNSIREITSITQNWKSDDVEFDKKLRKIIRLLGYNKDLKNLGTSSTLEKIKYELLNVYSLDKNNSKYKAAVKNANSKTSGYINTRLYVVHNKFVREALKGMFLDYEYRTKTVADKAEFINDWIESYIDLNNDIKWDDSLKKRMYSSLFNMLYLTPYAEDVLNMKSLKDFEDLTKQVEEAFSTLGMTKNEYIKHIGKTIKQGEDAEIYELINAFNMTNEMKRTVLQRFNSTPEEQKKLFAKYSLLKDGMGLGRGSLTESITVGYFKAISEYADERSKRILDIDKKVKEIKSLKWNHIQALKEVELYKQMLWDEFYQEAEKENIAAKEQYEEDKAIVDSLKVNLEGLVQSKALLLESHNIFFNVNSRKITKPKKGDSEQWRINYDTQEMYNERINQLKEEIKEAEANLKEVKSSNKKMSQLKAEFEAILENNTEYRYRVARASDIERNLKTKELNLSSDDLELVEDFKKKWRLIPLNNPSLAPGLGDKFKKNTYTVYEEFITDKGLRSILKAVANKLDIPSLKETILKDLENYKTTKTFEAGHYAIKNMAMELMDSVPVINYEDIADSIFENTLELIEEGNVDYVTVDHPYQYSKKVLYRVLRDNDGEPTHLVRVFKRGSTFSKTLLTFEEGFSFIPQNVSKNIVKAYTKYLVETIGEDFEELLKNEGKIKMLNLENNVETNNALKNC